MFTNFLLYVIALILIIPLTIVNIILVLIVYRKKGIIKNLSDYFLETAIDIDRFGNRNLRTLWNLTLIKNSGYKFGNINQTISAVLGINKKQNKLTSTGCILCKILHIFDKNHCEKSANSDLQNPMKLPFLQIQVGHNHIIRFFSSKAENVELKWHWDEEDRHITPLNENDWEFQFDNELPIKLKPNESIFIPKNSFHRVIKGTTDLIVDIKFQ